MNALPPFESPTLHPVRDTPKSRRTRARILDAAMSLFAEIGFHAATNEKVAAAAKLTRGAMLYHFPSREALVAAAASHIQNARASLLEEATANPPPGADATDLAIDIYWSLLRTPPFRAFAELEAVARTDAAVAAVIAPAQAAFDRSGGEAALALISAGTSPRLQASRDLARFLLEGLANARLTYNEDARVQHLLAVVKRAAHLLNRKGPITDLWPE